MLNICETVGIGAGVDVRVLGNLDSLENLDPFVNRDSSSILRVIFHSETGVDFFEWVKNHWDGCMIRECLHI